MDSIEGFFKEYRFLSNFHEKEFTYKGKKYLSSEHAYQAHKATNEQDHEWVRISPTAKESRKRGRLIECIPDFDSIKYDLMADILFEKFKDKELKELLLDTKDAYLEETNYWHDNYYGVCNCEKCQDLTAQNNLGRILMDLRKKLK